jgi:hypothetical protein
MPTKLNINDALKGINQVNFVTCPIDGVKVSSPKPSKSGIKQEILLEFQTQGSFYEWLNQTWEGIDDGHSEYRMSSKNTTPRKDWDLGVGLDGIKKLHQLGWEDGLNQLIRASSQFPTAGSQGMIPDTDIAGGTLDAEYEMLNKRPITAGQNELVDTNPLVTILDRQSKKEIGCNITQSDSTIRKLSFCVTFCNIFNNIW